MLNERIQNYLKIKYSTKEIVKSFNSHLNEDFKIKFDNEKEMFSSVIFIDIDSFTSKITGKNPREVRELLDKYYEIAIPTIYKYNGKIDRIAGDGILAIFSNFFGTNFSKNKIRNNALLAAESIIENLYGSTQECKASLSFGKLLFCKTGLTDVYEDYTVVGHPITTAYRLENKANANELLMLSSSVLAKSVLETLIPYFLPNRDISGWEVSHFSDDLKGIGTRHIYRQRYWHL